MFTNDLNYNLISRTAVGDTIRRVSKRFPDKVALVDGERRVTFKELNKNANRFTNFLLKTGLKKGDRVAVLGLNSIDFVTAYYGIFKAGLIWLPINVGLTFDDINYILEDSEAKLLFVDEILFPKIAPLVNEPKWQNRIFILEGKKEGLRSFADCLGENDHEPEVFIEDRDPAFIMYTSGTTGRPKGVMQSHLSIFITILSNALEISATSKDVAAAVLPMFHVAQFSLTSTFLNLGATVVVFKKFDPVEFASTIEKEKVTWIFLLPMMYRAILGTPQIEKEKFATVRYCLYAMAPMDESTLKAAVEYFKADFALATGQTEMFPATMIFKPEYQLTKIGPYWGTSAVILETEIMDEEGNILGKNEVGEIVHRGPSVMNGYWNNPEETERARKYGWHHTGDLGKFDDDGLLIFVDRKKDLIKTGGENVPSILVESVILSHPKVANAVVVGLPHPYWGEAVTAFVIEKPGTGLKKEEIIEHCKQNLAGFQVPKEVLIVDNVPTNATGKIQKFMLRNMYKDYFLKNN